MNAKWQKYDASREDYVKGLHQQLKELKGQSEPPKAPPTTHKHPDRLQKEIARLNRLLEDKIKEHTKLQLEAAEMVHARIADQERIQMLEQQVLTQFIMSQWFPIILMASSTVCFLVFDPLIILKFSSYCSYLFTKMILRQSEQIGKEHKVGYRS